MTLTLTLIRGLPGSGKTTLAKKLLAKSGAAHFEAEMFFEDQQGSYHFVADNLEMAHYWCKSSTRESLAAGQSVIVSNTFVRLWEMEDYIEMAEQCGAQLMILTCKGNFTSIHNVPLSTIEKMRANWQEYPEH